MWKLPMPFVQNLCFTIRFSLNTQKQKLRCYFRERYPENFSGVAWKLAIESNFCEIAELLTRISQDLFSVADDLWLILDEFSDQISHKNTTNSCIWASKSSLNSVCKLFDISQNCHLLKLYLHNFVFTTSDSSI